MTDTNIFDGVMLPVFRASPPKHFSSVEIEQMVLDISNHLLHPLIQKAVKRMERMGSQPNIDIALHAYTERQLVFEIGQQFRNHDRKLWVAFEQHYPRPVNQTTRTTADIVVLEKPDGNTKNQNLWIEVKSTGINPDGVRENNFSGLKWEHDFSKLEKLDSRVWKQSHLGYWVWLYLFDTYRPEINEEFGKGRSWSQMLSLSQMTQTLGTKKGRGGVSLREVLEKIERRAKDSVCSCIPAFSYTYGDYSALLVTATTK